MRMGSETMRAARVREPRQMTVEAVPVPIPQEGQVRIRLSGSGVCASNLPPWEGREWFTYPLEPGGLGHEGWGVVDALGEGVTGFKIGDSVAALSQHAYAEFDVADADDVILLPPSLADQPFPGEPLGCAMNIFRRADIRAGQTVAVVGIGFLGALLIQLARSAGAKVLAVAHRPFAQKIARQMGADVVIPMDDHYRIIEQVKELTDGEFCPVVIECTGKQWPLDLSAELCAVRGRLVIA
ncbi:MAG: zinc-binding dehydrogenase, partial [Armatimonadota bacterium]